MKALFFHQELNSLFSLCASFHARRTHTVAPHLCSCFFSSLKFFIQSSAARRKGCSVGCWQPGCLISEGPTRVEREKGHLGRHKRHCTAVKQRGRVGLAADAAFKTNRVHLTQTKPAGKWAEHQLFILIGKKMTSINTYTCISCTHSSAFGS